MKNIWKNFTELLKVVLKDPVEVGMLALWLVFVIYLLVTSFKVDKIENEFLSEVVDRAWAGAGFFWLYGFAAALRIAWHKIKIKRLENGE